MDVSPIDPGRLPAQRVWLSLQIAFKGGRGGVNAFTQSVDGDGEIFLEMMGGLHLATVIDQCNSIDGGLPGSVPEGVLKHLN